MLGLGDAAQRAGRTGAAVRGVPRARARAGRLALPLDALPETRALLHGHCHQKAFDALAPALAVLRLIPGLTVEPIESSCCGMAGSFGYEAEHYDVSMRWPSCRCCRRCASAAPDTLIVADGTSCRHQIADGTRGAREAVHVARVLERALRYY